MQAGSVENIINPSHTIDNAEIALLVRLKEGDERAFDLLYKTYSLRIYRKLMKMVKIDVLADELTQDVFVKVWTNRHLIDPSQSFRSYLFSIARNQVYDVYRKTSRDERLAAEIRAISTGYYSHTEETLLYKETEQLLDQAIEQLPHQQRLIFIACKMEGKTYEEIAGELGISTSTVNGHIVKATKTVKEYLSKSASVMFLVAVAAALRNF